MAMETGGEWRAGGSVDYKTVSVALAVSLVSTIGGFFGFWLSRDQQAAEDVRTVNDRQWERIQQLGNAQLEHGAEIRHLEQGQEHLYRSIDEREIRMRKMQDDITWLKSRTR